MKKVFLLAGAFWVSMSFGQQLSFSSAKLDFPSVEFPQKDSMQLKITNGFNKDIKITAIDFFEKYGNKVFSVSEDQFTIQAGKNKDVWVYFEPEHNILYNSEMVVKTDYRGSFSVDLNGKGKFSSYYTATYNKSEEDLKTAFKTLLAQGYVSLGYSPGRNKMFMEFDNQKINGQGASVNTLEGVYTGQKITNYANRSHAQSMGFNTEHTFPQGFFSSGEPMKSDLHHLYPTNSTANSQRGNLPFGVVTGSTTWSVGGSKKGGGVFEPRDVHKGAVARAMMYFVLRYQNYSNFLTSQESILRKWHKDYQPTTIDKKRNQAISLLQKNRNPFVDYPQYIERIQSISNNSVAPVKHSLYVSDNLVDMSKGMPEVDYKGYAVIVNTGNKAIAISNIGLTGNVAFVTTQSNFSLQPGEGHTFEMKLTPGGGGNGKLTFETDVTSQSNVAIDLKLGIYTSVEEKTKNNFQVYPNPAKSNLNVMWVGKGHLVITDVNGRVMLNQMISEKAELDVSEWSKGMYFLTIEKNGEVYRKSIQINN